MENAFDVYAHWEVLDLAEAFGIHGDLSDAEVAEIAEVDETLGHVHELLGWVRDELADRVRNGRIG